MAWEYQTASLPATTASLANAIAYLDAVMVPIDACTGWSVIQAATAYSSNNGAWSVMQHTSGARLVFVLPFVNNAHTAIVAAQSYSGANITNTSLHRLFVSYVPASEAGVLPAPTSGSPLTGQFLYSPLSSAAHAITTNSRIYVWADGDDILLALQRNTASATINDFGMFGTLLSNARNSGDTNLETQWVSADLTALGDTAVGQGQCFSAAGTRIIGCTPLTQGYLLNAARQDLTGPVLLLPAWFASATANVDTGNGIKGLLDPAVFRSGPTAMSLRATVDGQTRIHLGNGYFAPWSSSFGAMP